MSSSLNRVFVSPIRSRAVSVICVIWIYIGVGTAMNFALTLIGLIWFAYAIDEASGGRAPLDQIPIDFMPLFLAGIATTVIGITGARGAVRLLSLEERGRRLLIRANWLMLTFWVVFTLWVLNDFRRLMSVGMAFWTLVGVGIPIVIFGVMIHKLGNPYVTSAIYWHEHRVAAALARARATRSPSCP
jgi:hypothetical protein